MLKQACVVLIAALAAVTSRAEIVPADSTLVRIEGRTAPGAGGRIRVAYPGVTFHLRCAGSRLEMLLDASNAQNFFDISVDGGRPVRLRSVPGFARYPILPEGAGSGEHSVEIVRRTESWQGTCELVAFDTGGSAHLLPPPPAPVRRLLFIGDSVTCGEFTDVREDDPLNGRTPNFEQSTDAAKSYGFVLSRRLDADCNLVSYGGRGIIRDWQGVTATNNAPQFYERSLPDDPAVLWNPAAYVPDAIGIGLGTNDFSRGIPDQTLFVNAFVEFLRIVRRDAPQAWIFVMESPIVDDATGQPRRTVLRAYLSEVVREANDPRVVLAPVSHYPGVPHNGHPTGAEHLKIADEIEPLFRRALGW